MMARFAAIGERTLLRRFHRASVAEKFSAFGFVRIHRSVVVNAAHIEELRRCVTGVDLVRVSGGKKCTMTHNYKKQSEISCGQI